MVNWLMLIFWVIGACEGAARSGTVTLTPKQPRFVRLWIVEDNKGERSGVWLHINEPLMAKERLYVQVEIKNPLLVFRSDWAPWAGASLAPEGPTLYPEHFMHEFTALQASGYLYYFMAPKHLIRKATIRFTWDDPERAHMRFRINVSDWISQPKPL